MPSACRNLIWNDSILSTRYPRGVQSGPEAGTGTRRKTLVESTRLARDNNLFHINLSRDQGIGANMQSNAKRTMLGNYSTGIMERKMECSNKLYAWKIDAIIILNVTHSLLIFVFSDISYSFFIFLYALSKLILNHFKYLIINHVWYIFLHTLQNINIINYI